MQKETLIAYTLRLFEANLSPVRHYLSLAREGRSRKPRMNEMTDKETR